MVDPTIDEQTVTIGQVRGLAMVVGIELDEARAGALVSQAAPHFALLRRLDTIATDGAEPAAEFRLDTWCGAIDA